VRPCVQNLGDVGVPETNQRLNLSLKALAIDRFRALAVEQKFERHLDAVRPTSAKDAAHATAINFAQDLVLTNLLHSQPG
jgi:ParB-like chromosome segregation protein Spo0J